MSKIIPRFIYHLTNKSNYEAIMSSGKLKTSKDALFGEGIFTTELTNLFKRWRANGTSNLQEDLIRQARKDTAELVILKIPTKNLNSDKLLIRSQNKLFSEFENIFEQASNETKRINILRQKYLDEEYPKLEEIEKLYTHEKFTEMEEQLFENLDKIYPLPQIDDLSKSASRHIKSGAPAKYRKLYEQRKEAIEYIYPDDIPISQFEKLGEVNLDELKKSKDYDTLHPIRSIFSALLRGTPEEKGALLLNY